MTEAKDKSTNRRKAVYWMSGALAALVFWKLDWFRKTTPPPEKRETVKMLTKDGTLVEVDAKYLTGNRQKVNTDEIHNWVANKK